MSIESEIADLKDANNALTAAATTLANDVPPAAASAAASAATAAAQTVITAAQGSLDGKVSAAAGSATASAGSASAAATSASNAAATLASSLTKAAASASDGSTKIGTIIADADAAPTTVERRLSERPSIFNFDANADNGTVDASVAAQKVAASCDANKRRFLYLPNWTGDYKWGSTVTFTNPGVRIFGDQSGTYNRGATKGGWLIGQTGLARFFDLGASRTTGNPADQWQVDGLSFRQEVGVAVRTIDGVAFTSRTNGPDRAAIIRDASFVGLQDAITVENSDVATVLASLNVEGCVFQGCRSALNAKGHLFGLRFVGNQCEQNFGNGTTGVIGGSINASATITDNMLEGQPNVCSIDIPAVTGNRPSVLFARNYLEANSGGYVIRFRCNSSGASLEVGPNFVQSVTASDYTLFEGSGGGVTFINNDPFPFTIKNSSFMIQYGSRPFNYRIRGYEVRQLSSVSHTPEIVLADFANLTDDNAAWTHALPAAGTTAMTPFGVRNITPAGTDLAAPVTVAVGDLVCVNVLMRASQVTAGSLAIYVRNESGNFLRGGGAATSLPTDLRGRWALVSLPFIAQVAATSVRTRLVTLSGSYPNAIAGVTVRNYGKLLNDGVTPFLNDGANKVLIEPAVPNIV